MNLHYTIEAGRFRVTGENVPEFFPERTGIPFTENVLIGTDTVLRPDKPITYGDAPVDYTATQQLERGIDVKRKIIFTRTASGMTISRTHGELLTSKQGPVYQHRSSSGVGTTLYALNQIKEDVWKPGENIDFDWAGYDQEELPFERYLLLGGYQADTLYEMFEDEVAYYVKLIAREGVTGG